MGSTRCAAVAASVVAVSLLLASCAFDRPRVKLDGSSTVYPITEAVVEEFQKHHRDVAVTVGVSGTGGGFQKFCSEETDATGASRPITPSEVEDCAAAGVAYVELPVAADALAIVVHPDNDWIPDGCITMEQLNAAWESGSDVRRWNDLDPSWPDLEVKFYSPGHDSGTFDYFTETVNGEGGNSRVQNVLFSEDDNMLVHGVGGDRTSLGYFGVAYLDENRERLQALAVDAGDGCAEPTLENVEAGTYPLARSLFLYVREESLEQREVRSLVDFYLTNGGRLALEVGYMPLPDDELASSRRRFEEAIGG